MQQAVPDYGMYAVGIWVTLMGQGGPVYARCVRGVQVTFVGWNWGGGGGRANGWKDYIVGCN